MLRKEVSRQTRDEKIAIFFVITAVDFAAALAMRVAVASNFVVEHAVEPH